MVANIPPGVGVRFIVPISLHYQKCIFPLLNMHFPSPLRVYLRICGHDKSAPTAADGLPITWRTFREIPTKHSARRRGRFIVPVSLHNQKCIFPLLNMHFPSPLRVYLRICGHDKSAPTAADGLPITWRTFREIPTKHSARRRGRFIVPVSLHNQICISISPNTCISITKYAFPHY